MTHTTDPTATALSGEAAYRTAHHLLERAASHRSSGQLNTAAQLTREADVHARLAGVAAWLLLADDKCAAAEARSWMALAAGTTA